MIMKRISLETMVAVCLIALSALFYAIDYGFVRSSREVMRSIVENMAFMFIYIMLVVMILERLLKNSEKRGKMEKLNMVIGVFFNEVGTVMLSKLARLDTNLDAMRGELLVTGKWTDGEFEKMGKRLVNYKYELEAGPSDLDNISGFIIGKRDFLLRLLENPVLLEHETFTELLMAVFHLADEFANRKDFSGLPNSDHKHLEGDMKRAYDLAIREWLVYMKYLKNNYPYLFSLAVRLNPFDVNATPIVAG
jgi:hypothetical protein